MFKRLLFLVMVFFCLMSQAMAHYADPKTAKPIKRLSFLISFYNPNSYFYKELNKGFNELKSKGYVKEIDIKTYHNDDKILQKQFQDALETSDAIVMNTVPGSDEKAYIHDASKKNIPLVIIFTKPDDEDLVTHPNTFFVAEDSIQSGIQQGLLLAEYVNKHPEVDKNQDGKITLLNFSGFGGSEYTELTNLKWLLSTIDYYPKQGRPIKADVLQNIPAEWNQQKAHDAIIQLNKEGKLKDVEAITTLDGHMSTGVADALQELHIKNIPIVSRNASPINIQDLKDGRIIGYAKSSATDVAYTAGLLAYDYINHLNPEDNLKYVVFRGSVLIPFTRVLTDK